MRKEEKIYEKVKNSPANAGFRELCYLVEKVNFELRDQKGSHKIYKHKKYNIMMNLQPDKNGKAKAYQVRQVIGYIENYDLMGE